MTFKTTSLKPAGQGRYKLAGDLTLHGTTRPVVALLSSCRRKCNRADEERIHEHTDATCLLYDVRI